MTEDRTKHRDGRCKAMCGAKELFKWYDVFSSEDESLKMIYLLNFVFPFSKKIIFPIQGDKNQFATITKSEDKSFIELRNSGTNIKGKTIDFYSKLSLEGDKVKVETNDKKDMYKVFYFDFKDGMVVKPSWPCGGKRILGNDYCVTHAKKLEKYSTAISLQGKYSRKEIKKLESVGVVLKPIDVEDLYTKICKDQTDRNVMFTILSLKNQPKYVSIFKDAKAKEILLYILGVETVNYFRNVANGEKSSPRDLLSIMNEIGFTKAETIDFEKSYEEQYKKIIKS